MSPILQVSDLSKSFGGLKVTKGVNLTVNPGERHLLIGPNGAGKTTIISMLTGLYPCTQGNGWIAGFDIKSNID